MQLEKINGFSAIRLSENELAGMPVTSGSGVTVILRQNEVITVKAVAKMPVWDGKAPQNPVEQGDHFEGQRQYNGSYLWSILFICDRLFEDGTKKENVLISKNAFIPFCKDQTAVLAVNDFERNLLELKGSSLKELFEFLSVKSFKVVEIKTGEFAVFGEKDKWVKRPVAIFDRN